MSDRLADDVAVVTGGGAGIGEAACLRFAEEGAHVVAVDWDGEAARETVETIERAGGPGNSPTLSSFWPPRSRRF